MVHTKLSTDKYWCTQCHSRCVDVYHFKGEKKISCLDCGHEEPCQRKESL